MKITEVVFDVEGDELIKKLDNAFYNMKTVSADSKGFKVCVTNRMVYLIHPESAKFVYELSNFQEVVIVTRNLSLIVNKEGIENLRKEHQKIWENNKEQTVELHKEKEVIPQSKETIAQAYTRTIQER